MRIAMNPTMGMSLRRERVAPTCLPAPRIVRGSEKQAWNYRVEKSRVPRAWAIGASASAVLVRDVRKTNGPAPSDLVEQTGASEG